jgi:hypothetical protein
MGVSIHGTSFRDMSIAMCVPSLSTKAFRDSLELDFAVGKILSAAEMRT